jgi:hypothetical protein
MCVNLCPELLQSGSSAYDRCAGFCDFCVCRNYTSDDDTDNFTIVDRRDAVAVIALDTIIHPSEVIINPKSIFVFLSNSN